MLLKKVVETRANPPVARFKTAVQSEAGLNSWNFAAFQNSNPNNKFDTTGQKSVPNTIDWNLNEYSKFVPKAPESIIYSN